MSGIKEQILYHLFARGAMVPEELIPLIRNDMACGSDTVWKAINELRKTGDIERVSVTLDGRPFQMAYDIPQR